MIWRNTGGVERASGRYAIFFCYVRLLACDFSHFYDESLFQHLLRVSLRVTEMQIDAKSYNCQIMLRLRYMKDDYDLTERMF